MVKLVNTVHLKWTAVWLRGSSPLLDNSIGDIIQSGRMLMLHIKYPGSNLGISKDKEDPYFYIQAQVTQLVE